MPRKIAKTVLVLGAGASVDHGLPVAKGLRAKILETKSPLQDHLHARDKVSQLHTIAGAVDEFLAAVSRTNVGTIDTFLMHNKQFAEWGKLAISFVLTPLEVAAIRKQQHGTWYDDLIEEIIRVGPHTVSQQLRIITVNYDRTLRYMIVSSLLHSGVFQHVPEAMQFVDTIFIHLHGTLGAEFQYDRAERAFIGSSDFLAHECSAKQIITLGEVSSGAELNHNFKYAKQELAKAERVLFLGYGYDAVNMENLGLAEGVPPPFDSPIQIWGTAYKMGSGHVAAVESYFNGIGQEITMGASDLDISGFLQSHVGLLL